MRQYEVWWANLPASAGRRPVLLLSRDAAYDYLERVLVVEVTRRIRSIPVEVPLGRAEGLLPRCVANLDALRTVPKSALVLRAGALAPARVAEVKRALGFALGWPELKSS